MSKKEQSGELSLTIAESFQKMALGFMPGGHVVDEFLNFRSNLKQRRILAFSESLSDFFRKIGYEKIDEGRFTSEQFVDVFETVMSKVHMTNSERKLEYYRNILVNQIVDTSANEILADKIIQTVNELNELQLLILQIIWEVDNPNIYNVHLEFRMKNAYIRLNEKDELPGGVLMEQVLESSIFLYFLEELVSKGLIIEIERDCELSAPLRELKVAYHDYILSKCKFTNSHIQYGCSRYGSLLCQFIKGYDGK